MANGIFTSSEALILVKVTGITLDNEPWDTFAGGTVTVDGQTYQPGMFGPSLPVGGLRTIEDITVTRKWDPTLLGYYMDLHNAAGFTTGTVTYQPRMKGGISYKPFTYNCVLANVTRPDSTLNSADIQFMTLTFNVADNVTRN
jgi:hypothetical protein